MSDHWWEGQGQKVTEKTAAEKAAATQAKAKATRTKTKAAKTRAKTKAAKEANVTTDVTDPDLGIRAQLQEVKARASDLVRDVERWKKENGSQQKQIQELQAVQEENTALKKQIADQAHRISTLESALKTAEALAATGAQAAELGRQIADNLAVLAKL